MGSLAGISMMIGPTLFATVFAYSIRDGSALQFPGAAYALAALLLAVAALIAERATRRRSPAVTVPDYSVPPALQARRWPASSSSCRAGPCCRRPRLAPRSRPACPMCGPAANSWPTPAVATQACSTGWRARAGCIRTSRSMRMRQRPRKPRGPARRTTPASWPRCAGFAAASWCALRGATWRDSRRSSRSCSNSPRWPKPRSAPPAVTRP